MTWRRLLALGTGAALVSLLLPACGDDTVDGVAATSTTADLFAACNAAIGSIGEATQRYVAGYESSLLASADPDEGTPTTAASYIDSLDESEYQEALRTARAVLEDRSCEPIRTRVELFRRLQAVEAESPVADAVLRQLISSLVDPASGAVVEETAGPGDDLRDAVAGLADGSTLRLEAGEYHLDAPLVLLNGIQLVGSGDGSTTIVSTAGDAAIVALTDRTIRIEALDVRHEGPAPASVVLGGPAASLAITNGRLSGAVADDAGQGGAGVLMFSPDQDASGRGTTLELTDVELSDNEAAGAVVSGGHRTSMVRVAFLRNGQCGLCFFDAADGSVEDSTFEDNTVGIATTGTSRPSLVGVTVRGGDVGLQVGLDAAPVLRDVTFVAQASAAAIYGQAGAGRLDDVRCEDVDFGLVVGPDALPSIGTIECEVFRSPD